MFLQLVVSGISIGSIYALVALAMVIIYKTLEVPNFAQGEMSMISTFVAFMFLETYGQSFLVSFTGALVFAIVLGIFLEFVFFKEGKGSQCPQPNPYYPWI